MPNEGSSEEVRRSGGGGFPFKFVVYFVLLLIGAGGTYLLAKTKPSLIGLPKNQAESQAEADKIVAQVGKLISLPADEKPTVATITNIDQLKGQPFFVNAKNDDKILVYQKANKAIIYRPSENRVIDVGAVNVIGTPAPSVNPEASPTASVKPTPTPTPVESPAQ